MRHALSQAHGVPRVTDRVEAGARITDVVIGIGNPYRHDDGAGPAVAAEIERLHLPGVRVVMCDGEPVSLLTAWDGARLVVVIDAVRQIPARPGRVHRLTANQLDGAGAAASSHGFGVPYALQLSRALNRQPSRLVLFGVEAADTSPGSGLSAAVSAAVPTVVASVRAELETPSG